MATEVIKLPSADPVDAASNRLVWPLEWSMAICLLKPIPLLEPVPRNSNNLSRRFLLYLNYAFALIFLAISWIFPLRILVFFINASNDGSLFPAVSQSVVTKVYFINIFLYQVLGMVSRTCMFVHFFHPGRRIDRTLNALRREIGPQRTKENDESARRWVYVVVLVVWSFLLTMLVTTNVLYATRFETYSFMFYPFSNWLLTETTRSGVVRGLAIAFQNLNHFASESASAMGNAFVFFYNVLLACCFKSLKDEFKQKINKHQSSSHEPIDIEHYRLRHLRLGAIVTSWDANVQPVVSATLISAFLCCITFMYLVLYGESDDSFYRFLYASMLLIAATLVIINLGTASYLNCSAHSIADAVLLLRQDDTTLCDRCQLSFGQQQAAAIQVNLFLNQVSSEPIGITMLGLTHIHRSNVLSVKVLFSYSGGSISRFVF